MKKLKWLLGLTLVIVALAVGGFTYYTRSQKADFLKAKVQRGDIESAISATGTCCDPTLGIGIFPRLVGPR